jgi:hypothetical protein
MMSFSDNRQPTDNDRHVGEPYTDRHRHTPKGCRLSVCPCRRLNTRRVIDDLQHGSEPQIGCSLKVQNSRKVDAVICAPLEENGYSKLTLRATRNGVLPGRKSPMREGAEPGIREFQILQ